MNLQEYKVMYELEDSHWWYVGMRRIILSLIDSHHEGQNNLLVLDAGCGTGAMTRHLARYGKVIGSDISSEAIKFCTQRALGRCELVQSSLAGLPFDDETFDLIASLDVICVIEDDTLAFQELGRVLKTGGRLIVSLPAYEPLRSEHDLAVDIKRRYTKGRLKDRMERAGLNVERIAYANTLLLPVAVMLRIAKKWPNKAASEAKSDLWPLPAILNRWLADILFLENRLLRHMDLPFGLSVFCLARK